MDDKEIKQMRSTIFQLIRIAEERLESASFILEREANVDAIPILAKAVDLTAQALLSFKQRPLADLQKNIKSLENEYQKEGLYDDKTMEAFQLLYEMNEKYKNEIELDYDYKDVKNIFDKAEDFLSKTYKYLKPQLSTPKERVIKRKIMRISLAGAILICAIVVIFFLVKIGISVFGPKHGLLARYYNNIDLRDPAVVERIDKKIDFNWGPMSPHSEITENFSARWEGRIKVEKNDDYTFIIVTDEGTRLFIDDKIVIDTWSAEERLLENSGEIRLRKGFHKMRLEYYFNQRHADIKLQWSSNSFKRRTVKSKDLYPPPEE